MESEEKTNLLTRLLLRRAISIVAAAVKRKEIEYNQEIDKLKISRARITEKQIAGRMGKEGNG